MKKRFLLVLALAVALLASALVVNTLRFTSKQIQVETVQPLGVDEGAVAGRLAGALRFRTVSFEEAGRVATPRCRRRRRPSASSARPSPGSKSGRCRRASTA
ncbi:MAG TPA: hypothetical protein VK422_21845 [Pyrinomonadaceae bacterium]|nr:hypothetical protein [Pyrinomonadaceae bacterium]